VSRLGHVLALIHYTVNQPGWPCVVLFRIDGVIGCPPRFAMINYASHFNIPTTTIVYGSNLFLDVQFFCYFIF